MCLISTKYCRYERKKHMSLTLLTSPSMSYIIVLWVWRSYSTYYAIRSLFELTWIIYTSVKRDWKDSQKRLLYLVSYRLRGPSETKLELIAETHDHILYCIRNIQVCRYHFCIVYDRWLRTYYSLCKITYRMLYPEFQDFCEKTCWCSLSTRILHDQVEVVEYLERIAEKYVDWILEEIDRNHLMSLLHYCLIVWAIRSCMKRIWQILKL